MLNLDDHIDKLGLSTRPAWALRNDNVETIGQLVKLTPAELLRLPGLGRLSLSEIENTLALHGFKLAEQMQRIAQTRGRWQPEETAPLEMDVITYDKNNEIDVAQKWGDGTWYLKADYTGLAGKWKPTHWMPLPEKPND